MKAKYQQIDYVLKPYRLARLVLAQLDSYTNEPTSIEYSIYYADMENQPDFILLRQHYDEAIANKPQENERIQAIIDEKWYFGVVVESTPPTLADGHWLSLTVVTLLTYNIILPKRLQVKWQGETEPDRVSPWDVMRYEQVSHPMIRSRQLPPTREASEDELRQFVCYTIDERRWHHDYARRHERLHTAFGQLLSMERFDAFKQPVDVHAYDDYPAVIAQPADLMTMMQRLEMHFYRCAQSSLSQLFFHASRRQEAAIVLDMETMFMNAITYNEESSVVAQEARLLAEVLMRFIECAF